MKLIVLLLLALGFLYRLALNIVQYRSAGNPISENVAAQSEIRFACEIRLTPSGQI
jgi:hypothetical protein